MFQMKFGSYTFGQAFYAEKVPLDRNVPIAKSARRDGSRIIPGYLEARRFAVKGGFVKDTSGDVRGQLDALKAALNAGTATFQTDSDRVWQNCQASSYSDSYEATWPGGIVEVSLEIVTGDPFLYGLTAHTSSQAVTGSSASITLTNNGNVYAAPQVQVTAGASGALACQVSNTTTGESFLLSGAVISTQILTVDSRAENVDQSGFTGMGLFDGLFPRLAVGSNTITLAVSGGSVSNLAVVWNDRWY